MEEDRVGRGIGMRDEGPWAHLPTLYHDLIYSPGAPWGWGLTVTFLH